MTLKCANNCENLFMRFEDVGSQMLDFHKQKRQFVL